ALLSDASTSALAIAKIRIPAIAAMAVIPPEPDIVNVGATHILTAPQMMGLNAGALGLTRNDRSLGGYVLDKARSRRFAEDDPPEVIVTADLVAALQQLAGLPTARLERLFAEHVDLTSHRLDAWVTGLFDRRLRSLRASEGRARGVYIGAYGYV